MWLCACAESKTPKNPAYKAQENSGETGEVGFENENGETGETTETSVDDGELQDGPPPEGGIPSEPPPANPLRDLKLADEFSSFYYSNDEFESGNLSEGIYAKGRYYKFEHDGDAIPLKESGKLITNVLRYKDGPCFSQELETCQFDTVMMYKNNSGNIVESITVSGRYFNFEKSGGIFNAYTTNGTSLNQVKRYADGPCADQPLDSCVFNTREFITLLDGTRLESITIGNQYYNYDIDDAYKVVSEGKLDEVSHYQSGPCSAAPAGEGCRFTARAHFLRDDQLVESIIAYGKAWNFDIKSDGSITPWAGNGFDITTVYRYQYALQGIEKVIVEKPCSDAPAGQCVFDTRTYREDLREETLIAYGRFFRYTYGTDSKLESSDARNGVHIDFIKRYREGPCANAELFNCKIDTLDFTKNATNSSSLLESITAYGKFWNYDAHDNFRVVNDGVSLNSVSQYSQACAGQPTGACLFTERNTFKNLSGEVWESLYTDGGSKVHNNRYNTDGTVDTFPVFDLTTVIRYIRADGPCGGLAAGDPCIMDSVKVYTIPNGTRVESITAYGKFWNYDLDSTAGDGEYDYHSKGSLDAVTDRYK